MDLVCSRYRFMGSITFTLHYEINQSAIRIGVVLHHALFFQCKGSNAADSRTQ